MCFVLKDGQELARRKGSRKMGPHGGNSSRGDNPGKGLEVRKKIICPGSFRQFRII